MVIWEKECQGHRLEKYAIMTRKLFVLAEFFSFHIIDVHFHIEKRVQR